MTADPVPDLASAKRARLAISLVFLLHGALTGAWAPHIPFAKAELGVGPGVFGWLLLAMAAGGVLSMPLVGPLINRFGSTPVVRIASVAMSLAFVLPVLADGMISLAIGLFVFGAALGVLDVAMNAHGLAVEIRMKRAVMSAFHGWFSVGAAGGAAIGSFFVARFPEMAHVAFASGSALAMAVIAWPLYLPAAVDKGHSSSHFGWPTRATLGLGILCFLALMVEGAVLDWSALHLRTNTSTPVEWAGFGYAAFAVGMALSRFLGDALRMRFGSVALVLWSALATALGMAVALGLDQPAVVIAAFAVAGLGVGNIAPVLFAGGGRAEPDAPGRGIAAVTTLGYSGFLVGPPLIGMVAEGVGLRLALGLTVVAAIIIAMSARASRAADGA